MSNVAVTRIDKHELQQVRHEVARRLKELRELRFHGQSAKAVADIAKEEHIPISHRSIVDWENPKTCNPRLDKLQILLTFYGSTLGNLFYFSATTQHSTLVARLLDIISDDELRKALTVLLKKLKPE